VADRVELLGFVSADELIALYAGARAAYYAPLNEDYGYVTVESFLSRKPVVTTSGLRAACSSSSARARRAWSRSPRPDRSPTPSTRSGPGRRRACARWARPGYARVADITWDAVIDRLTESIR
jgi:hypothetical protein